MNDYDKCGERMERLADLLARESVELFAPQEGQRTIVWGTDAWICVKIGALTYTYGRESA